MLLPNIYIFREHKQQNMAVEENGSGQPGPAQTRGNNVQADENVQHPQQECSGG